MRVKTSLLYYVFLAAFMVVAPLFVFAFECEATTISLEMKLVPIEAGRFRMGVDSVPLPLELTKGFRGVAWDRTGQGGDYDEVPVHDVTVSKSFLISETEVTIEQYRLFRP